MIKVDNLAFSYSRHQVLNNLSLTLEEGKIYGLLGENGVGKTTLLTLLCGLKKPQQGSISVEGFDPYKRQPSFLQDVYFLPDEVLPVHASAEDWASSCGSFWAGYDHSKFLEILGLFEVAAQQKMDQMSSGQLKKTYIAFALSLGVKTILMDEPTNGLDIPSKTAFRSAILKYTREDSTIIISTHQVRDLENIVDPIVILDSAEVLLNASVEKITSKLYFDYGNTLDPEALYTEQIPGGFVQVVPNLTGDESKINVEALFNAVHKNKDVIKRLFDEK